MKKNLFILSGIVSILLIWAILSFFSLVSPVFLPSPFAVFKKLFILFLSGNIFPSLFATLYRWLIGFLLGSIIGILLGLVIGSSENLYYFFEVPIDFFRSLPSISLLPLLVLFFGIGDLPKFVIIVFSSVLFMAVNTSYGVRYANEDKIRYIKTLNATKFQIFKKVILPEAMPSIFAGLRITLSIALIVTVGSEMILGTGQGLGKLMSDVIVTYKTTDFYSVIIITGALGYFSNKLFRRFEDKIIHWKGK